MKKIVRYLPNTITFTAMLCGVLSITASIHGAYEAAARAILIASLLDVLDGWVARLTNSSSRLGVKLDSFSDFFSFCIAPAVLVGMQEVSRYLTVPGVVSSIGFAICIIFSFCGGYRLVRFTSNADGAESKSFVGMPTTAAAIILASGMGMSWDYPRVFSSPMLVYGWMALTLVLAILMVSRIPYKATKSELSCRPQLSMTKMAGVVTLFVCLVVLAPVVLFVLSLIYMFQGLVGLLRSKEPETVGQTN